jgi:hypothetical protein
MEDRVTEGAIGRLVRLLREHLDFLDEMGLDEEFDQWLDNRYAGPERMCSGERKEAGVQ